MDNSIFEGFSDWLDKILEANSFDKVLAFNLYEGIKVEHDFWLKMGYENMAHNETVGFIIIQKNKRFFA